MFPLALLNPSSPAVDPVLTLALLHFEGANNSTVFTDSSDYNRTFNVAGGSPTISTLQSKFGVGSLKTNGSTYEGIYYDSNIYNGDLNIGNSDFTFECWFYQTEATATGVVRGLAHLYGDSGTRPINIFLANGTLWGQIQLGTGGSVVQDLAHQDSYSINAWNHVALVRKDGYVHSYLNGVKSASNINVGTDALRFGVRFLYIGPSGYYVGDLTYGLNGYIDEFRFRKEAMYTADFTPPTSAFTY